MKPRISVEDNLYRSVKGEIEFISKDVSTGSTIDNHIEPNIIKIFSKEILSHRVAHSKVWDPDGGTGSGEWVTSTVDPDEDFSVKYIVFGGAYDSNGVPTGQTDTRYYSQDAVTQLYIPISLNPGADFDGGLINAIPISEPGRPLKRIENIDFEASYAPSGSPLLFDDVRAINNVTLLETTLRADEYNGFGLTDSDSFDITEVALVGGKELGSVGACECDPRDLFLEGTSDGDAFLAAFSGGNVVTIDSGESASDIAKIKEGDQIKLVDPGDTAADDLTIDQVSPYYLVVSKSGTGRELELDRTPVDSNNVALTGSVGIFRDTMRIFSHRILETPVRKNASLEILVRWRLKFS